MRAFLRVCTYVGERQRDSAWVCVCGCCLCFRICDCKVLALCGCSCVRHLPAAPSRSLSRSHDDRLLYPEISAIMTTASPSQWPTPSSPAPPLDLAPSRTLGQSAVKRRPRQRLHHAHTGSPGLRVHSRSRRDTGRAASDDTGAFTRECMATHTLTCSSAV